MNKPMYKVSQSTGKTQIWFATASEDTITVSHGDLGGKLQEQSTIALPKNLGRSNATTGAEQAILEVGALYEDRYTNKHYRDTEEEAIKLSGACTEPRKIHNYKDHGHKLPDMVYVSVKKDGSRGCVLNGELLSKIGRTEVIKVDHIRKAVEALGEISYDSEVFAEGLSLQRIRSAWLKPVRTDKEIIKVANDRLKKVKGSSKVTTVEAAVDFLGYNPNEDAPKLKLHVFDIPVTGVKFEDRITMLLDLQYKVVEEGLTDAVDFLFPVRMKKERVMDCRDQVVLNGDEGIVVYSPDDMYEFGKRSYTCQKSKPRSSLESKVLGVEMCKNGDGKLVVQTGLEYNNVKYKVMMKVTRSDGLDYPRDFETMKGLVGKWITVSYEALSDAGKPQKPVGECVRKCNDKGEPLE